MIAANIRGWRFWQIEERIYWLYKPIKDHHIGEELKSKHALLASIWRFSPERKNTHPAPFPLALPTRCIYSIMDEKKEGLVIDPYCGSGTTLVAAKILGYDFLGIDISKEYIESTKKRLENYKAEEKYVKEEMDRHVVRRTFKERKENGEFTGRYGRQRGKKPERQSSFEFFG